jgi:hypothetical protein
MIDREYREKHYNRNVYTIEWIPDREMRQAEIFREDLMLEIRWLQFQEQKAKEENGNN